jgi:hypothetical protein
MRLRGRSATLATLLGAVFLALSAPLSATAADIDVPLHWTDPATQTVEYGSYWDFTVATDDASGEMPSDSTVHVTGASTPVHIQTSFYYDDSEDDYAAIISTPSGRQPLEAGHYSFTVSSTKDSGGDHYTFSTADSAQLTVTKAPIGVDLRVINDPNSTGNAIVSMRLTGNYIDNLYPADGDPMVPLAPSGTWKVTVANADGSVALQRSIVQTAGFASTQSFYWPSVPAEKTFSATAVFTADSSIAGNFAFSPSPDVSYTSSPKPVPSPVPTELASSTHADPSQEGFTIPFWLVMLLSVAIVGLAITVTVLAIKSPGAPASASGGVS